MSAWEQIRRLWIWGVPIIAIATALASNPTEEMHLQTLREAVAARHQVAASFDAAERADPRVRYVDLWLLSYTKRGHAFTTWGLYGMVIPIGQRGLKLEPGAVVVR